MAKKRSSKKNKKPQINKELEGFNIKIDAFGEIKHELNIKEINEFLNKNVKDKKLVDRDDYQEISGEEEESLEDLLKDVDLEEE